ncbi:MAG TPA: penicillin-binding protein 2 [Candidatus Didemnitutus sp.]|nr:penicillin-binding protein 2 [Candidatus Didemnitutus sp.]
MSKGFASNVRMTLLAISVLTCFLGIAVRLFFLHVYDRDELLHFVEKARRQIVVDHARRGAILDTKGNLLATSRTFVVVGADPEMLQDADQRRWPDLARLLNLPETQVDNALRRGMAASKLAQSAPAASGESERRVRWVKLAEEVDERVYDQIAALNIHGVYGQRGYKRVYPDGELAAHVLGFVNREGSSVTGAERHFDLYLRGQDGWIESEKDGARRELAQFRSREVPVRNGDDVVLTIDAVVQHLIEEELHTIATKFDPHFATIIVSDPQTGRILGMANYPTFDPNDFGKVSADALRNYAVTDIIEPGSTFKIVAAGAALDQGLVTPNTVFDCGNPYITYKGKQLHLPKEDEPFGNLNVADIVAHSSNRGAAQLAMLMGEQKFYDYAKRYGFGASTDFELGGEVRGILEPPEKWDGLTITRMPMGHSVAATPLQIHMAMSAVANGGTLLRPQIIREIRDPEGNVIRSFAPEVRGQVLRPSTAALLASLLTRVVTEGTAKGNEIPGFEVAGKTGTTEKLVNGHYVNNRHVSSFVGFFPASRPQVVLSVIVDDAKLPGGAIAYGRAVAAPSFKHVAEQLIQYLDISPVQAPDRGLLALGGAR